ncbi:DUF6544 family protein [Longispora sp. K20-0274]|uniref:DUF6544 family protein n=1 Tax=Longispora sp. K20-0274 TaxID=3088255 RepID=UPI0039994AB8
MIRAVAVAGGLVLAAAALAWAGLRVPLRPLRPVDDGPPPTGGGAIPSDWPEPVRRHYLASTGPTADPVDTFALWGRARMRIGRLPWLPATFWSEHQVGRRALQRITVTWFGLPVLRGVDSYADGHGEMRIGGRRISGPEIDQGENLFVWAELVLLPSALLAPGVRWEPVDEHAARLVVPFGTGSDELEFRFDPDTGLLCEGHAMRYRDVGGPKLGWRVDYRAWHRFGRMLLPSELTVTWADQDRPWFVLTVDGGTATNENAAAD